MTREEIDDELDEINLALDSYGLLTRSQRTSLEERREELLKLRDDANE